MSLRRAFWATLEAVAAALALHAVLGSPEPVLPSHAGEPQGELPARVASRLAATTGATSASGASLAPRDPSALAADAMRRAPLAFEQLVRHNASATFFARGPGYGVEITPREVRLTLEPSAPGNGNAATPPTADRARMVLVGAAPARLQAVGRLDSVTNYMIGNDGARWRFGVPQFGRIAAADVYPGIDVVYYGNAGRLQYDFVVRPGASPRAIALAFPGARTTLARDGTVEIEAGQSRLRKLAPVVYQEMAGERQPVQGRFALDERAGRLTFDVGPYDTSLPLVIDPVLEYGTTFSGTCGACAAKGVGADDAGNIYLAGYTSGVLESDPAATPPAGTNAYVVKFNASGQPVSTTYWGGSSTDSLTDLAVTGQGDVVFVGSTTSSDLPGAGTPGYYDSTYNGPGGFVARLSPSGSLVFMSYIGSGGSSGGDGRVALTATGDVLVALSVDSFAGPVSGFDPTPNGSSDVLVARFSASGALAGATFLGTSAAETVTALAAFGGDVAVAGSVNDPAAAATLASAGAYQTTCAGTSGTCAFVSKLSGDLVSRRFSTLLGAASTTTVYDVALDGDGTLLVAGGMSSGSGISGSAGAYAVSHAGGTGTDAFVGRLSATGATLSMFTYLGGTGSDRASALAVDPAGQLRVFGVTGSVNFITTPGAFKWRPDDFANDAFVLKLRTDGTDVLYSTRVGARTPCCSPNGEYPPAGAVDRLGRTYIAGETTGVASSTAVPTTTNAFDRFSDGFGDSYLYRFASLLDSTLEFEQKATQMGVDPRPIPDGNGSVDWPAVVSGAFGTLERVEVSLHITHTRRSDLQVSLVGPDGSQSRLIATGVSGTANFGTSCSARTSFSDAALAPVGSEGSASPYVGVYRPVSGLSVFSGKPAGPGYSAVNGQWRLRVEDLVVGEPGTVQCWGLRLVFRKPLVTSVSPNTLPTGGGTVTILGNHFEPGVAARVGGVPATTNFVTATGITVVLPSGGAGPVDLAVTNPDGRSAFALDAVTYTGAQTLTVSRIGSGTVSSAPAGISCGVDCSETYAYGTVVTLTATPAAGAVFGGWTGDPDCSDGAVTMTASRACTATFTALHTLTVTKSGSGSGVVTSAPAGISCGADCSETYGAGTVVTLTQNPGAGSVFLGWSGACTGTGACQVTLDAARAVGARYELSHLLTVTKSGSAGGTVTSAPAGISCGLDCSEHYLDGTVVQLTASPGADAAFVGWAGACAGTGVCQVAMTAARSVSATFGWLLPTVSSIVPASGPTGGGTLVAISGSGFVNPSVTVGGAPAQVLGVASGALTIATPPGAVGSRDVVVTATGGVATVPGGFTYNAAAKVADERQGAAGLSNAATIQPSLSGDGRYLAFVSLASTMVTGDTNGVADVFVRDRATGTIVRVSVGRGGAQADGPSSRPRISADGRRIAFVSTAANLVPGDTNGVADVFLHDRDVDGDGILDEAGATATLRVSVASTGQQANGASGQPDLSPDGLWVAFVSTAANLHPGDTNGVDDVFLHHWPSGQTRLVSLASDGTLANGPSRAPAVSAQGRLVVFASDATNLVGDDTNMRRDVFVHDTRDATTVRVSVALASTLPDANGDSDNPSIDDAGRTIAFQTLATNVVAALAGQATARSQIVVFRLPTSAISPAVAASAATRVAAPVIDIGAAIRKLLTEGVQGEPGNGASTDPEVSGDGSAVAFQSEASDLVPGDSNDEGDVFVGNVEEDGGVSLERVSLDTDGNEGASASRDPAISGDGRYAAFESDAALTPATESTDFTNVYVRGTALFVAAVSPNSVVSGSGTEVEITGTGFAEGVRVRVGGVEAARVDRRSSTLLLAELGAATAGRVLDVVVWNPDGETAVLSGALTLLPPAGNAPVTDPDLDTLPTAWEERYGLDPRSAAGHDGAKGDPDGDGVTNDAEWQANTHPRGVFTRYLAEGAAGEFFATRIGLANPSAVQSLTALVRFQRSDGTQITEPVVVPPLRSRKVTANQVPGLLTADRAQAEFSTVVEADGQVVVDRQMWWDSVAAYGSHAEAAVSSPSLQWYLAEGATHSGFNLFYLIQNPTTLDAEVEARYLLPTGTPIVKRYTVPRASRFNVWANTIPELAATDVSAVFRVVNNVPVIVERAMYLDTGGLTFGTGHEGAGVTAPATSWFLAEGSTGDFFDTFVLLANPASLPARVQADYLLPSGDVVTKQYDVAPESRFTVWVDREDVRLSNTAVSVTLTSLDGVPILAERSMWWPGDFATWAEAHASCGATATGTLWAFAEGEVSGPPKNTRTYVLVANTSPEPAEVEMTLLLEDVPPVTRRFAVPPTSRLTVDVAFSFPEAAGRVFGGLVESLGDPPAAIAVERAIYNDASGRFWAAGNDQLVTRLR